MFEFSYVTGQEILEYLQDTAKQHDLEKYVRLCHKVTGATWDEDQGEWMVRVEDSVTGQVFEDHAHFLINGSGFLK